MRDIYGIVMCCDSASAYRGVIGNVIVRRYAWTVLWYHAVTTVLVYVTDLLAVILHYMPSST